MQVIKYFETDPNNLARGPGKYYLRSKGFYSKIKDEKVNIPFQKLNKEHTINYIQSGGTFRGLPDNEFKKLKKNLGL